MTFPVRANLLTNDKEASAVLFRRLLSAAPSNSNQSEGDDQDDLSAYTLTVWSSPTDDVEPADLASFIRLIGKFRYDYQFAITYSRKVYSKQKQK